MANSTKLILFTLALILLIVVIVFGLNRDGDIVDDQQATVLTQDSSDKQTNNAINTDAVKSVEDAWQWQDEAENITQQDLSASDELFTRKSIHDALKAVEIDEYGDLVLDNNALFALDEALERIHNQLDKQALQKLIELIKEALPGKVGEQTAQLVENYHSFLGAQAEFNQLHEYSNNGPQTLATIEQDRGLYSELQTLRELHLGSETSDRLFAEADAGAQFMFDMMSLDLNATLTPEQIALRREEIQKKFDEQRKSSSP